MAYILFKNEDIITLKLLAQNTGRIKAADACGFSYVYKERKNDLFPPKVIVDTSNATAQQLEQYENMRLGFEKEAYQASLKKLFKRVCIYFGTIGGLLLAFAGGLKACTSNDTKPTVKPQLIQKANTPLPTTQQQKTLSR